MRGSLKRGRLGCSLVNLGKIQATLLMQEPDLTVKLVADHGWDPPESNI